MEAPKPEPIAPEWKWICPVADCGHTMKRDSAGRRAHMQKRHAALCSVPCASQCLHGCCACVPDCVLFKGERAPSVGAKPLSGPKSSKKDTGPTEGGVLLLKRQAAALKRSEAHVKRPFQPSSGTKHGPVLLKRPAAALKESEANVKRKFQLVASPAKKARGRVRPRRALAAPSEEEEEVPSRALPRDVQILGPMELSRLLLGGANADSVLRGVDREVQLEVLELLRPTSAVQQALPVDELAVPIGFDALPPLRSTGAEQRSTASECEEWATIAATYGATWPSNADGSPPPLQRVGPPGGCGLEDSFTLGVVVGPSGAGVTRLLRSLAQSLELPAASVTHFRSDQAVASYFEDAVSMLPRVGLNSIPAWMRPYHVLSNGQQQRVRLAKGLTHGSVVDDFGSGIDEQEIHSVAHSIGKFIRQEGMARVLIGTHSMDAVRFLQPDFVVFVTGHWSVNPNPFDGRRARVCLAPSFMGKMQQASDSPDPDQSAYEHTTRSLDSTATRVPRRTLEVHIKVDERTTDAANAFELEIDGVARCSIPTLPRGGIPTEWKIGIVVGPSGTGKTMTLKDFAKGASVLEGIDVDSKWPLGDEDVVFSQVTKSAGDASKAAEALRACCVPLDCWLRLPRTLSRSEAWRAQLACQLVGASAAEAPIVIVDEFTTQLDRPHAQALCQALEKYVRSTGVRLLCATVHRDVLSWLRPCWHLDTEHGEFTCYEPGGAEGERESASLEETPMELEAYEGPSDIKLWEPPTLTFDVQVVADASTRPLWSDRIKQHHYLSSSLKCGLLGGTFVAIERSSRRLAAFHASSMLPGARTCVREYRLVVLPEWQGFGVGPRLSNFIAARWLVFFKEQGYGFSSMTAHPRLGELRQHDPCWAKSSTNLRMSKTIFGQIGFAKKKQKPETPTLVLPHGTCVRILHKLRKAMVSDRTHPDVQIDLRMTTFTESDTEESCGIFLQGDSLNVSSLKGMAAEAFGDVALGIGWAIVRVNAQDLKSRGELRRALACVGRIATLTFREHCGSQAVREGRPRATLQDAINDVEWLRMRSVAQADLKSEKCHIYELMGKLRWSSRKCVVQHLMLQGISDVVRPDIPELPLDVLPALIEAVPKPRQSKPRITYSHSFIGPFNPALRRDATEEHYQNWMKTRVPECRAEGRTHQGAVEASIQEFGTGGNGMRLLEFNWTELGDRPGDLGESTMTDCSELDGGASPVGLLALVGLCVGEGAIISDVTDKIENLKGLTHNYFYCYKNSRSLRILAVRRGARKLLVTSLEGLAAALMELRCVVGNTALLYVDISRSNAGTGAAEEAMGAGEEQAGDQQEEEQAQDEEEAQTEEDEEAMSAGEEQAVDQQDEGEAQEDEEEAMSVEEEQAEDQQDEVEAHEEEE